MKTHFAAALVVACSAGVALADEAADAFAAIQETLQVVKSTPPSDPARETSIDELYGQCTAFLQAHLATASDEQLTMTAGITIEVGTMKQDYAALETLLGQLKSRETLPERLAAAIPHLEGTLAMRPGSPAPAFEATDIRTGEAFTLEGVRGKVVLLDFWATWCPPCKQLMGKELQPLHETYKDTAGFELVSVGMPWRGDTPEKEIAFAKEKGYHWTKVFNTDGEAGEAYGIQGIPFLCLVDEEGKILVVGSGWAVIEQIKATLAERFGSAE
jgi:thiol-disulfide isomerase/thioredoxin